MGTLLQNARHLRKTQTEAENRLWYFLRGRRFVGYKFRRQYEIDFYIVDFVCLRARLVVELDGGQHADQVIYDEKRTKYLNKKGFTVIRFWNNEVFQHIDSVLDQIYYNLTGFPSPSPCPSPAIKNSDLPLLSGAGEGTL